MSTTIDRICAIVKAQGLDVVTVFDRDGAKLDYVEGTPDEVCTAIELTAESFDGTIIIEAYQAEKGTVRGRKTDANKPFRWRIQGRGSVAAAPAPMAAPVAPAPTKVPDIDSIKQAAESKAEARIAEYRTTTVEQEAAELRARLAEVEQERDELEAELDADEPEDMNAAPKWWENEESMVRMMDRLGSMFGPRRASTPVPKAEGVTEEERALLAAMRAYQEAHPTDAAMIKSNLLSNYGPATDETKGE